MHVRWRRSGDEPHEGAGSVRIRVVCALVRARPPSSSYRSEGSTLRLWEIRMANKSIARRETNSTKSNSNGNGNGHGRAKAMPRRVREEDVLAGQPQIAAILAAPAAHAGAAPAKQMNKAELL